MFALMVTEAELDNLKLDAESLKQSEDEAISELGRRMLKAVHRTGKKLGFKYASK